MTRSPVRARSRLTAFLAAAAVGGVVAAGCGSSGTPTASGPSWAASLGTGVTVITPRSAAPGNDSPGAVVHAYVDALNAGHLSAACPLLEPAGQALCQKAASGQSTNGAKISDFKLGYVAIKGDEALVGITGTNCNPAQKPTCSTNTDPAAIFSSGMPFGTLFSQALAAQNPSANSNSYSLAPCLEVNAKWYVDVPRSDL